MHSLINYLVPFAVERFGHQPVKTQICLMGNMKVNSGKFTYSPIIFCVVAVLIIFIVINVLIQNTFFIEKKLSLIKVSSLDSHVEFKNNVFKLFEYFSYVLHAPVCINVHTNIFIQCLHNVQISKCKNKHPVVFQASSNYHQKPVWGKVTFPRG